MHKNENSTTWFSPLSIFACLTFFNLAIIYCVSQYLERQTMSEIFSFTSSDAPGPLETFLYTKEPIFGNHYFGDLYQTFMSSRLGSPYYSPNHKLISQYPPLAHWIFWPVSRLNPRLVIFTFLIFTFLLTIKSLKSLTRELTRDEQNFSLFLMCLTGPVVSTLDRGSLTGLIFVLVVSALFGNANDKASSLYGGLAHALKIFPLVYSIEIARTRDGRISGHNFFRQIFVMFFLISLPFLFLTGKLSTNFFSFWTALSGQSSVDAGVQVPGRSISAFFYSLNTLCGTDFGITFVTVAILVIGVILGIFCLCQYFGGHARKTNVEERLLLTSILICVVPRIVGTYQLIFFLMPFVLFMKRDTDRNRVSIISVLLMLTVLPMRYRLKDGVYLDSLVTTPILMVVVLLIFFAQVNRGR